MMEMGHEGKETVPSDGTAGPRLIAVYELLEHILSYLPANELLRTSHVNSSFATVIRSSTILQAKFRMLLAIPLDSVSFPVPIPRLFDYIGSRWSYPSGKRQHEPYVLAWMRKSQLGATRWRSKSGSWRKLLLSSESMNAITVHVEGWGQLRADARKGELGQYNLKLRYEKLQSHPAGITLGDLADVAFELCALDQSVDVKFSTYLNPLGESIVHDWELPRMLSYRDVVAEAKRNHHHHHDVQRDSSEVADRPSSRQMGNLALKMEDTRSVHRPAPVSSMGEKCCVPANTILRGFCEHEGACCRA